LGLTPDWSEDGSPTEEYAAIKLVNGWQATCPSAGLGGLRYSRRSNQSGDSRVYRGASRCSTQANLWNRRETQTGATAHWLAAILRGLRRRPCGRRTLPSRISNLAAVKSIEITCQTLLTFASPFPTRLDRAIQLLAEPDCLSWGFPKMPLRRISSGSPLPGTVHEHARSRFPSGRERQLSSMFRPRGFSPPRRFPPPSDSLTVLADRVAALAGSITTLSGCVPVLANLPDHRADAAHMFQRASDHGVHHVSVKPPQRPLFQAFTTTRSHPRDAFLPSEASPPTTAAVSGQNR